MFSVLPLMKSGTTRKFWRSDLAHKTMPAVRFLHSFMLRLRVAAMLTPVAIAIATPATPQSAPNSDAGRVMTVRSDIQEADSKTGIITARGNVQINYPAREIQATSAQAQYFSRERRIVLSGDVYVLQQGNSIRGETVTYLIDQGIFVATPKVNRQVESVYIVPEQTTPVASPAPLASPSL